MALVQRWVGFTLLAVIVTGCAAPAAHIERARTAQSFDTNWRFFKGDPGSAEPSTFDDSQWRQLDVPHDWSIEGPFARDNPAGGAGAFLPTGVGWYRKHFTLPSETSARHAMVEFDGVMANSDVWINGFHLGHRPYGYVTFRYDLTGHLNYGDDKPNVLAVRADDSNQPASRWYAGAGIYRHVRLLQFDALHFEPSSTFVTTPTIDEKNATVHVHGTIVNESTTSQTVTVEASIRNPSGENAGTTPPSKLTVDAGKSADFDVEASVPAIRWDLEHPNMHQAVVHLREGDKTLDDDAVPFGIRSAEFKADTGFWLNGKNIKLKGVCIHGDMDGLGTAVPLAAWEHRLREFKTLGVNAIRTSHNPVAPEFLDLCDRMGFLVMDEFFDCWTVAKTPYDYSKFFKEWSLVDLRDSVRRDRNHPSIVLYSAVNEIHDTPHPDVAIPILKSLVQAYHENDPTRPVTQALFRPNQSNDFGDGLADLLDVVGVNYRDQEVLAAHRDKPTRKIIGTENAKDFRAWTAVRDNVPYAGQFLWAGADYLGEARRWPAVSRENGLLDLTDHPHPIAYQRQSWWFDQPMVSLARQVGRVNTGNIPGEPQTRDVQYADWTPENQQPHNEQVVVFSNAKSVELLLNGKSLGSQDCKPDSQQLSWNVPFEPGTLTAIAKTDGQVVAKDELHTAGKAAKLLLSVDRSTLAPVWDDVAFVTVTVVDANGICVPNAGDLVQFQMEGPGALAAVENADVNSTEPFQAKERHAYRGVCTAIVRATASGGRIQLKATASGLEAGSIDIETAAKEQRP